MTTAAQIAVEQNSGMRARWQIIQMLRRPRTAREIADTLRLGKTTAGQHLNKLEAMGIARRAEVVDQMQIWELATPAKKSEVTFTTRRVQA